MYIVGQKLTRFAATGTTESITLPPIDFVHLREINMTGSRINGFHVLPSGLALGVRPNVEITLPPGPVNVFEPSGADVTDSATVKLRFSGAATVDADNMIEARVTVEYADEVGRSKKASASQKNFWPRSWSESDISEAIYQALAESFRKGATPQGAVTGTTQKGIQVDMRINSISATPGAFILSTIRTAYPVYTKRLTGTDKP